MVSKKNDALLWSLTALLFVVLIIIGRSMYLLFHSIAELVAITVAWAVFLLGWNTRRHTETTAYLVVGIGYLFVGALDLLHTLAYGGMNVIPGGGPGMATQLWIAARFMETAALIAFPLCIGHRVRTAPVFLVFGIGFVLAIVTVTVWPVFPVCFVPEAGLTPFKKISEYVIMALLAGAGTHILLQRRGLDAALARFLITSIALTIFSEAAFTLYTHPYGTANMIGHLLKILSFLFIYKALLVEGLNRPLESLFHTIRGKESALKNRDAILTALAGIARKFMEKESDKSIEEALGEIGGTAGVDRVYIFENHEGLGGRLLASQRYEWSAPGTVSEKHNPDLQNAPYEDLIFTRWKELFLKREPVFGNIKTFPEGEREFLHKQKIVSIAVTPIFVEETLWGFIGFDDCGKERTWSNAELGALKAAGELFTAVILKNRYEENLKRKEHQYRALFELSLDAIFISNAGGEFLDVNDRACKLLGYTRKELLGMTAADCHPKDTMQDAFDTYEMVRRMGSFRIVTVLLTKERRRIDVELVGGMLDPVRGIYQGIARDITEQKKLERKLLQLSEHEREKLGRELHDSLCQELKSLEIQASLFQDRLPEARDLAKGINGALRTAYSAAKGFLPHGFGTEGLIGAIDGLLEEIGEKTGIGMTLDRDESAVPAEDKDKYQLYRICQEAVLNAAYHSKADTIRVFLGWRNGNACFNVTDNGTGIEHPYGGNDGLGIPIMKARADVLGAVFTVHKLPRGGTDVRCISRYGAFGRRDDDG